MRLVKRNLDGSVLIEVVIASTVAVMGMFAIYVGFIDVLRSNIQNDLSSQATNIINSQIDKDAKLTIDTLITNPPVDEPNTLPAASLNRIISRQDELDGIAPTPDVIRVKYELSWTSNSGITQRMTAEHAFIRNGLTND